MALWTFRGVLSTIDQILLVCKRSPILPLGSDCLSSVLLAKTKPSARTNAFASHWKHALGGHEEPREDIQSVACSLWSYLYRLASASNDRHGKPRSTEGSSSPPRASFAGRPCGYIWSMFTKNSEHGDGIILCEGERWEQIREFAHKIFRNFGLGRTQMEEKIVHYINYMIAHIDSKMEGKKQAMVDMEEPISLCVANIIQDFVLGKSYTYGDPQFRKFKNLIDAVVSDVASKTVQLINAYPVLAYLPIPALRRYKENGFALQRYFLNVIREHKERLEMDGEPRDFMEAYLREMTLQRDNPHFNIFTLALASGDLWTGEWRPQ